MPGPRSEGSPAGPPRHDGPRPAATRGERFRKRLYRETGPAACHPHGPSKAHPRRATPRPAKPCEFLSPSSLARLQVEAAAPPRPGLPACSRSSAEDDTARTACTCVRMTRPPVPRDSLARYQSLASLQSAGPTLAGTPAHSSQPVHVFAFCLTVRPTKVPDVPRPGCRAPRDAGKQAEWKGVVHDRTRTCTNVLASRTRTPG